MFNLTIIREMQIKARWLFHLSAVAYEDWMLNVSRRQEGGQALKGCIVCREF